MMRASSSAVSSHHVSWDQVAVEVTCTSFKPAEPMTRRPSPCRVCKLEILKLHDPNRISFGCIMFGSEDCLHPKVSRSRPLCGNFVPHCLGSSQAGSSERCKYTASTAQLFMATEEPCCQVGTVRTPQTVRAHVRRVTLQTALVMRSGWDC